LNNIFQMLLLLLLSSLLGALIGLERETHGRAAGLRTHMLVCLGTTLFTLCSFLIAGNNYDPGRITAQIVTGIGFLGAGSILRQGNTIVGLTSAASIWATAAIGIAVAIGGIALYLAVFCTILVFFILHFVPQVERKIAAKYGVHIIEITIRNASANLSEVLSVIEDSCAVVKEISVMGQEGQFSSNVRLKVNADKNFDETGLSKTLVSKDFVINYKWD
jgi:putative Mg2+ transporter-C (MgtC) family protein